MIATMPLPVAYEPLPSSVMEAGDVLPFEAIVERYERPIYRFLRRMSGDPDDAADLTQETFLKAYRAYDRFGDDRNVGAWLRRIAGNSCLDLLRRRKRIAWSSWDLAEYDCPAPRRDDNPEAAMLGAETRARVRAVIASLAPRQRRALILREWSGLSCAAIGDDLSVSEGAAKAILFRAREEFRRRYRRLEDCDEPLSEE